MSFGGDTKSQLRRNEGLKRKNKCLLTVFSSLKSEIIRVIIKYQWFYRKNPDFSLPTLATKGLFNGKELFCE